MLPTGDPKISPAITDEGPANRIVQEADKAGNTRAKALGISDLHSDLNPDWESFQTGETRPVVGFMSVSPERKEKSPNPRNSPYVAERSSRREA
jgi:hypothetical protein